MPGLILIGAREARMAKKDSTAFCKGESIEFSIRPYKLAFIGCEKGELRDSDEATVYSLDDFFSPHLGSDESK